MIRVRYTDVLNTHSYRQQYSIVVGKKEIKHERKNGWEKILIPL